MCRQAASFAPNHMAGELWNWDSNPGQTHAKPLFTAAVKLAAVAAVDLALGRSLDLSSSIKGGVGSGGARMVQRA